MSETPLPHPLLEDAELERLDIFLDSERVDADALDLIAAHGFLLALAVAPREVESATWIPELFHGEPEFTNPAEHLFPYRTQSLSFFAPRIVKGFPL